MRKRLSIGLVMLLAAALCMTATSCLPLLSTAIGLVYNSALETDEIVDRETVYGDANPLGVTFEDGKMYAIWDVEDDSDYALTIKGLGKTATYSFSDKTDEANTDEANTDEANEGTKERVLPTSEIGKADLSALGYAFSQNLRLTLEKTQPAGKTGRTYAVGYAYDKMSALDYDTYAKPVKAGFAEIDYYMGSRAEWFDFWSYLLIFREGCKYVEGCYKLKSNVYMGYDYSSLYSTNDVKKAFANEVYSAIDAYEDSAAYTYTFEVDDTGKYGTIYLTFTYDNNPKFTSDSASIYKNALHVGKTETRHYSVKESYSRIFPIDKNSNVKGEISVSASDQLYFALKKGYRPVPVKGSNAEILYNEMRDILARIVTDANTEAEKAHYIYDYIVDTVVYDYEFTDKIYEDKNYSTGQLFSYGCLYMEGVFGYSGGKFDEKYKTAICDGLSKAFLSMAAIEGMEVIKISGTVNDEGHAWNKIRIDGVWYMVDTTWGNTLDETSKYEYLNHDYLLVPDDNRHKETPYITYPSATARYDFKGQVNNGGGIGGGAGVSPWTFGWGRSRYAA